MKSSIHKKVSSMSAMLAAGIVTVSCLTPQAKAALTVTVTGDATGTGSIWVFDGTSEVITTTSLSGFTRTSTVNEYSHGTGELSGEYIPVGGYNNIDTASYAISSGTVSGSIAGSFAFDALYLDTDSDPPEGSDDFGWYIGSQAAVSLTAGETITYNNFTLTTDLDITTFGEGASAIVNNGDTFTVSSTSEIVGDLTMTFTAAAVPEPSSTLLVGLGSLALLARRKR